MTTRFQRRILGAVFGVCLLATACTRPENDLGVTLLPEDDLLNVLSTDTVTLTLEMVLDTAVLTDEINPVLCARYADPALGTVNAGFFSQLRLEAANPDFGAEDEFFVDSLVLVLGFDGLYPVPDRAWEPAFNVYSLTEEFYLDSAYTTNDAVAFDATTLELDPAGTYRVQTLVDTIGDVAEDPQVRIPLDLSLADMLLGGEDADYASSDDFVKYFPGFYVELEESVVNQRYQFDLEDGTTRLEMYYRTGLDDDQDTTTFAFTINNNTARFTRVERTYSGFAQAFNDPMVEAISVSNGQGYVQGGAGFSLRIGFPHIEDFNGDAFVGRNINRAELIVPNTATGSELPEHEGMILREKDDDGKFQLIGDHNTLINIDGGYEVATDDYRFILTRHVQDLLNGEARTGDLYLLSSNRQNQLLRNLLNGPGYTIAGADQRMRLVLTLSR
ncbi:MAG: DUF4270 family protein [Flavobacteriales bacterium]